MPFCLHLEEFTISSEEEGIKCFSDRIMFQPCLAFNRIAGELVLEIESLELAPLEGRHVRGLLNADADTLSRGSAPSAHVGVEQFVLTEAARLLKRCA